VCLDDGAGVQEEAKQKQQLELADACENVERLKTRLASQIKQNEVLKKEAAATREKLKFEELSKKQLNKVSQGLTGLSSCDLFSLLSTMLNRVLVFLPGFFYPADYGLSFLFLTQLKCYQRGYCSSQIWKCNQWWVKELPVMEPIA